jgi:hypothetical protein
LTFFNVHTVISPLVVIVDVLGTFTHSDTIDKKFWGDFWGDLQKIFPWGDLNFRGELRILGGPRKLDDTMR